MYKYERGIVSKVSNEGESVGKLVISSNRLDCNGFGGWPQIGFGPAHLCALSRRGLGALGPDSARRWARRCR